MRKRATTTLFFLLMLCAGPALAQPQQVTIDEINQLDQDALDSLQAKGTDLTTNEIESLLQETQYNGEEVVFTAIIMSEPHRSGLASFGSDTDGDGTDDAPNRIHVFVRDTAAASQGKAGMDLQLVESAGDDAYGTLVEADVGEVYNIAGTVTYFGHTIQFDASTLESVGSVSDLENLPESVMDPVTITTAEANKMLEGGVIYNWENFNALNNQFVRFENATVLARTIADDARPSWTVTTDGGDTYVENYDHSLRYRNDKDAYEDPPFDVREEPFRPPAPGSTVNVQGFLTTNTTFEAFPERYGAFPVDDPEYGAAFHLSPFADSDLEVLETPTVRNVTVSSPDGLPEPSETITITVDAEEGTVADVELRYVTSANPTDTTSIAASSTGDATYEATIDGIGDGQFVTYFAEVTDTDGEVFPSFENTYRVLEDGINEIADIQQTMGEQAAPSPFAGDTLAMDITATVQTDPDSTGLLVIQDDSGDPPAPWSGIYLVVNQQTQTLRPGDQITISEATIEENFSVTRLVNPTFEQAGSGDPIPAKLISSTSALEDESIAESHEGMMLRFENVEIASTNPDGSQENGCGAPEEGFGEFSFTTQGEEAALRADDASTEIPCGFNINQLEEGQELDYIQGAWTYSFGNYKLLPLYPSDVGGISIPTEQTPAQRALTLESNAPNPFSQHTTIRYELEQAGQVRLSVYDVLGRKVATLVNERQAAGPQSVTFQAKGLPSGLYFYRLQVGSETRTRQMTLVR